MGLTAVAAWSVGLNALFFTLDKVSPIGSRPILVGIGALLTIALTVLLTAPRRRRLPAPVGRRLLVSSLKISLFAGAATYFVLMQVLLPVLYTIGFSMGAFFPPK